MAKIYPKSKRTIRHYMNVGAKVRLCKASLMLAYAALGTVLKCDDIRKLCNHMYAMDKLFEKAYDMMLQDFPPDTCQKDKMELSSIFHGALTNTAPSGTATNAEVIELARKYANGLFE